MSTKVTFGSKIGLIAATVGSAVGLGNIWRFPAEVHANGGAAFLLVYILCMLILGIPVMIAEFSLGRGGRNDAEGVFRKLAPGTKWWIGGAVAILASYLILSFYMVVAGWTFEYLWQSVSGNLYDIAEGSSSIVEKGFKDKMTDYVCTPYNPLINIYVLIIINTLVLLGGVQKGIERMSNILMPVLFVLLLIFAVFSLTLPNASAGLKYFFTPDFSKITVDVVVNALGQSFFSLSLGMGILITYASYYPKDTKLVPTAFTVCSLDLLVAVLMGIIIFPAIASFGLEDAGLAGTTLVFVTLPEIFESMPGTQLWSILFFLLLLVAALTSTISISEVSVAWLQQKYNKSRKAAVLLVMSPLFILSSICSLSFSSLEDIKIAGLNIFDFLDTVATNWLLPTASIITCLFIGWKLRGDFIRNEITNNGLVSNRIYPIIAFMIKYCAPPMLIIILFESFFDI